MFITTAFVGTFIGTISFMWYSFFHQLEKSLERQQNMSEQGKQGVNPIFGFFTEVSMIENMSRTKMEKVLPDGMLASHFTVLNHLIRLGKQESPAQLASAFQISRPSMTNTLQKLERKEYINIASDPLDGRGKQVLINEKGRQAHAKAVQALAIGFDALGKDLGEDLFTQVLPALQKIRKYMDNHRS